MIEPTQSTPRAQQRFEAELELEPETNLRPETTLSAGFADPVHDAQRAFRAVLNALSRPGISVAVGTSIAALALGPAMAHSLLALTDDDTAVWWQQSDAASTASAASAAPAAARWLRFHTGATVASTPGQAAFAVIQQASRMAPLATFATGQAESPERSTTLLVEVAALDSGPALEWSGPGIRTTQHVRIAGLPLDFWHQWQANHASFPQGVDIIFTCNGLALGLPRTTRVRILEGL